MRVGRGVRIWLTPQEFVAQQDATATNHTLKEAQRTLGEAKADRGFGKRWSVFLAGFASATGTCPVPWPRRECDHVA